MRFGQHAVDTVLFWMEGVEAGLKLNDDKNDQADSNSNSEACNVDHGVTPVTHEAPESCFQIVFKHRGCMMPGFYFNIKSRIQISY
jgi:hypothetical protein